MVNHLKITKKVVGYIYIFELSRLSFSCEILLERQQIVNVELIAACT